MDLNLFLFYFAYISNLLNYIPNLLASPIIGGEEDTSNYYKYHVFIQHNYHLGRENLAEHLCSGSIIHNRYILSIAHHFMNPNRILHPRSNGIVVLSGASEFDGRRIIKEVSKIFIPDRYTGVDPYFADIAVLQLSSDLDLIQDRDIVAKIPVDRGNHSPTMFDKEYALMLGNGDDGNYKRHFLMVRMARKTTCPEYSYAICAENRDTSCIRKSCDGDGGSPLVFSRTVIGVLFLRKDYENSERGLMVFTRISTFIDFIREAKKENRDISHMHVLEN